MSQSSLLISRLPVQLLLHLLPIPGTAIDLIAENSEKLLDDYLVTTTTGSSKYSNENLSRNASYDADDPGIMSEVETSATGAGGSSNFKRSTRLRSSLPIVRTMPKTADRSLGLVFLQHRNETKRALLPNEITTLDTVKALFVRSFPRQLNMNYLDSRNVRIYIHDSGKDMFYELEDLRDVGDRSVLRIYEQDLENGTWQPVGGLRPEHPRVLNERMNQEILAVRNQTANAAAGRTMPGHSAAAATGPASGPVSGNWMDDPSYFSEPEFESASDFQDHHIHRSRKERASFGAGGGGNNSRLANPPASVSSPVHHQSQSQYYGTIIIPAYRTAAMMQQQQNSMQQQQSQPQATARQSLDRGTAAKAFPGASCNPFSFSFFPTSLNPLSLTAFFSNSLSCDHGEGKSHLLS